MNVVLAPSVAVDRPARISVEPRLEDRWFFARHADRRPIAILVLAAASFALHATVGFLIATGRSPAPPTSHEIAVEIVQDVPKPPPPTPVKPKAATQAPNVETPPPPPLAKAEPPNPEQPKPTLAKAEPAKSEVQTPDAPKPPSVDETRELDALQKELASLKAEHAALKSTAAATEPIGQGALANSFQAIALPGAGPGSVADAATYQEIVFSQLAKAKGLGPREGKAGTAGVRFEIDAAGALVSVEIATPSGMASLDAEALDIVRRAAPFPPPPKDAERQFFANVNFVPQASP